ncbi:hypothetical protein BGZ82_002892, partial [Podila clonocystis]
SPPAGPPISFPRREVMKFFATPLFLFAVSLHIVTALSCAGAMDNLFSDVQQIKKYCKDPSSNMCKVMKNNCRVAKSECDRICRLEGRNCPQTCPNQYLMWRYHD